MFYVFVQRAEHFVLHHRDPISFGDQILCFIASDSIVTLCLRNACKLRGQPVGKDTPGRPRADDHVIELLWRIPVHTVLPIRFAADLTRQHAGLTK